MSQRQPKERGARVYHAVEFTLPCPEDPYAGALTVYALVAEVETTSAQRAFGLTNHGDEDWTLNPGVRAFVESCRSTSVGDMIITPDDEAYLVLPVGFRQLTRL